MYIPRTPQGHLRLLFYDGVTTHMVKLNPQNDAVKFQLSVNICGRDIDFVVHTVVANGLPLSSANTKTSQLREQLIRCVALIDDEQLFLRLFDKINSRVYDARDAWKFAKANAHSLEKPVLMQRTLGEILASM